jgi:hypothetical protein
MKPTSNKSIAARSLPLCAMRVRASFVAAGLGVFACITGCFEASEPGTLGREGMVVFQAPTDLVWSSRLAVGSTFSVAIVAKSKETTFGEGVVVTAADDAVVTVDDLEAAGDQVRFRLTAAGPGRTDLVVNQNGIDVDRISVQAAHAASTMLVDAALVGAIDSVDPRLPARFAIVDDAPVRVMVSAADGCGEPLLDAGASTVVVRGPQGVAPETLGTVVADGLATFVVMPTTAGEFSLVLETPGLSPLPWGVLASPRSAIDEVHATAAAVDADAGTVTLWGRAFVDDIEVIGQAFSWAGSERVSLSTMQAVTTTATVSFPADGEPPDDRPATVTAELMGEDASVDLLALTEGDLVNERDAPPERIVADVVDAENTGGETSTSASTSPSTSPSTSNGAGCAGDETACDPLAAGAPLWVVVRRLRRRLS